MKWKNRNQKGLTPASEMMLGMAPHAPIGERSPFLNGTADVGKDNEFLSPQELGLSKTAHKALVDTLNLLESNEVIHFRYKSIPEGKYLFNMISWKKPHECGTVCCIGGTADMLSGNKVYFNELVSTNKELLHLFYGDGVSSRTTPAQAAVALRGYLETGKTDWSHIKTA